MMWRSVNFEHIRLLVCVFLCSQEGISHAKFRSIDSFLLGATTLSCPPPHYEKLGYVFKHRDEMKINLL